MKRLLYIGFWYIFVGCLAGYSLAYYVLWPFLIVGSLMVLAFLTLRFVARKKAITPSLTEGWSILLTIFLTLLPFIEYATVIWFYTRPYIQKILVPEQYDGIITIIYGHPNGQPRYKEDGEDAILVSNTGFAVTQYPFQKEYHTGENYYYYKKKDGSKYRNFVWAGYEPSEPHVNGAVFDITGPCEQVPCRYEYRAFLLSKTNFTFDADSLYEKSEGTRPLKEFFRQRIDSIVSPYCNQ